MYLLDTNVISEVRKPRPHGAVVAWLQLQPADRLAMSAVTILELQRGAERTRRQDTAMAHRLDEWIDALSQTFSIISVDAPVCREAARLMAGRSEHLQEDALIAATAGVHRLTVVTRNVRDFAPFGTPTLNPFTPLR